MNEIFYTNYNKRSKASIYREIKHLTDRINARIENNPDLFIGDDKSEILVHSLRTTQASTGQKSRGLRVAYGNVRKSKAQLIRQARELQAFENIDFETGEALVELEEKFVRARDVFKDNYPEFRNISDDEYRQLVETLGAIGPDVVEAFGSEQILDLWNGIKNNEEKASFLDVYNQSIKELEGGYTRDQLIQHIKNNLSSYSEF